MLNSQWLCQKKETTEDTSDSADELYTLEDVEFQSKKGKEGDGR